MTLSDISSQLYSLSVAGYFNGEKFTKNQLNKLLRAMFQDNASQYIGEIALPDGRWWFKVLNLGNGQFDYFIPKNKEQNRVLAGELAPNNRTNDRTKIERA